MNERRGQSIFIKANVALVKAKMNECVSSEYFKLFDYREI